MALLRYRLPASGAAAVSPAMQTYTHTQATRRPLPTSDATALATQAYTPDTADDSVQGDSHHVQFVSAALDTGTVFSVGNTIKLAVQGLEPNANCNQFLQLWVGVYSNDGATLRQTLRAKVSQAAELGTALAGRFLSTTVATAYTTVSGDRLVIEVGTEGNPAGGGGVQGHNASFRFGADGAGGDLAQSDGETGTTLNPWFEVQVTDPTLIVGDMAHGHTLDDAGALTQANTLAVADALHDHAADAVALVQANALVVADTLHAQSVDEVALEQANTLVVAEALHAQSVDAVALIQANTLAVADALHGHAVDNVTLEVPTFSAALSGTAASGMTEGDAVAGGRTIILTLTGATWIP